MPFAYTKSENDNEVLSSRVNPTADYSTADYSTALHDTVVRHVHKLAAGLPGSSPLRRCMHVSSDANGSTGLDMGDRTDRRQPLHHRVFTI